MKPGPVILGTAPTFPDGSVQMSHTPHLMARKQEWERMMNGPGTFSVPHFQGYTSSNPKTNSAKVETESFLHGPLEGHSRAKP